jgi:hypothetical protein
MAKTIFNFGAGVNSTALAIEMRNRGQKPDLTIFADTGCELPETYAHLEIMKKWFEDNGWDFRIVKSKYGNLYDYYFNKGLIPSRQFRDCTDKFKKIPITKELKVFKKEGVNQIIGIDCGEKQRCRASGSQWISFDYPLVRWNIDRKGCIRIIKNEGMKIPEKSGCFLCPFQSYKMWQRLATMHPDLFRKAVLMEKNNKRYPKIVLGWNNRPLERVLFAQREQKRLFTPEMQCDGWCML